MARRRITVLVLVVLATLTIGGTAAWGDPTNLNEFCKDPAVQEFVQANHGQCAKPSRELLREACKNRVFQEAVAELTGAQANVGQCNKALENLFFPAP